jgi:alpha-maltose-1-phosphate synthase
MKGKKSLNVILLGSFIDYQIQLANQLCQSDKVSILSSAQKLDCAFDEIIDDKVNYLFLGRGKPWYHPKGFHAIIDFIRTINKIKPDIIHYQAGGSFFYLLLLPFITKYPFVITFHDVKQHVGEYSIITAFIRYFFRKFADNIIVHGEYLKNQMINLYNIPKKKIHFTMIGEHEVAPFLKYAKEIKNPEVNYVLFFGRIYKYKGLEYLIKAEPFITSELPNTKIIIAGAGENFNKYYKMIGNRIDNYEIYNYRLTYEEGATLFQKSNVVCLPYIDASQSGVVCSAYGFKKPVVVTKVGSIPEIVEDGVTGIIVPSKDSQALGKAIVEILKVKNKTIEMGNNAHKKLKTDLSWNNITKEIVIIYKKTIDSYN